LQNCKAKGEKPLNKTKSDEKWDDLASLDRAVADLTRPKTAVEIFLAKVETVAENLRPPDRRELLTAAKICRAEMRKGSSSPWRESFKRS
jgi:hypothetical protein